MKHRMLVSLLFSSLASIALAQDPAPTPAPAPKLVCDAPEYDFGVMDNSQNVEHTFIVRNEGTLTLEITQVRPSCGCTVANISERNVAPGSETKISTRLSLVGRQGQQHKAITVESNDPERPQYILTLKGVAGSAIDVQPPRLTQIQVPVGTQPTGVVQVVGVAGTPFKILSVEASTDRISASVETVEEGRSYRVLASPSKPLEPGQTESTLIIHTDHPQRPTMEVPVVFIVPSDVMVAPRELIFPAPSSEPVIRYIIVRTGDKQAFQITKVETPDPAITTEVSPFGANGYRIQLSNLKPEAVLDQRVIRVHTSIAGQAPIEVPLHIMTPAPANP